MRKFFYVARMAIYDALEYRVDIFLYVLSGIARPLIFLGIWLAALSSGANTPFSKSDFVQYYLLIMVVGIWASTWTSPFLISKIKMGRLSPFLLKPFSYLFYEIGNNVGEKVWKLGYVAIITIIMFFYFRINIPTFSPLEIVAMGASLLVAFFLTFLIDFCVGLFAFWTGEAYAFGDVLDLLTFILSGLLFPLALLPSEVQKIAGLMPFRYTLSFPIEIYLHKLSQQEMVTGLVIEVIWLLLIVFLYKYMWINGLKRYAAIGA